MPGPAEPVVDEAGGMVVFFQHGEAVEDVDAADRHVPERLAFDRLSARERQVLTLVAEGLTARQIAGVLAISPKTVEQHKGRILAKLGVPNQAAAVVVALAAGLASKPAGGFDE